MNMVLLHSLEKKKNKKACYDEECKLLNAQKSNTRAVMLQILRRQISKNSENRERSKLVVNLCQILFLRLKVSVTKI